MFQTYLSPLLFYFSTPNIYTPPISIHQIKNKILLSKLTLYNSTKWDKQINTHNSYLQSLEVAIGMFHEKMWQLVGRGGIFYHFMGLVLYKSKRLQFNQYFKKTYLHISASLLFRYVVFFNFMELLVTFMLHKKYHCNSSIFIFDGCWIFYTNYLVYYGLIFGKNLVHQYVMSCSWLSIIINLNFLWRPIIFQIFFIWLSQSLYLSHNQLALDSHDIERLLHLQVYFWLYWYTIL